MSFDEKLLGRRIKEARQNRQMSQAELADELGCSQRDISQIENGNRVVKIDEVAKLALVLEVPVLYFFEGNIDQDYFQAAIVEQLNRLKTDEDKKAVIEIVRLMCDTILR
jgi:transcriptional regulator with XRE-family HTH domain